MLWLICVIMWNNIASKQLSIVMYGFQTVQHKLCFPISRSPRWDRPVILSHCWIYCSTCLTAVSSLCASPWQSRPHPQTTEPPVPSEELAYLGGSIFTVHHLHTKMWTYKDKSWLLAIDGPPEPSCELWSSHWDIRQSGFRVTNADNKQGSVLDMLVLH